MPAMTMVYKAQDPKILKSVKAGCGLLHRRRPGLCQPAGRWDTCGLRAARQSGGHGWPKSAADRAKAEALQALRSLRTEGLEIETARITRWCQTVVKPLVRQVIDTHDTDHVEIDQLLEEATRFPPAAPEISNPNFYTGSLFVSFHAASKAPGPWKPGRRAFGSSFSIWSTTRPVTSSRSLPISTRGCRHHAIRREWLSQSYAGSAKAT
jgi:hypothetical protein